MPTSRHVPHGRDCGLLCRNRRHLDTSRRASATWTDSGGMIARPPQDPCIRDLVRRTYRRAPAAPCASRALRPGRRWSTALVGSVSQREPQNAVRSRFAARPTATSERRARAAPVRWLALRERTRGSRQSRCVASPTLLVHSTRRRRCREPKGSGSDPNGSRTPARRLSRTERVDAITSTAIASTGLSAHPDRPNAAQRYMRAHVSDIVAPSTIGRRRCSSESSLSATSRGIR
jgi:hypothetical protein